MLDVLLFTAISSSASLVTSIVVFYKLVLYRRRQIEKNIVKDVIESREFKEAVNTIIATSDIYKKVEEIDKKIDQLKVAICLTNEKIRDSTICRNS